MAKKNPLKRDTNSWEYRVEEAQRRGGSRSNSSVAAKPKPKPKAPVPPAPKPKQPSVIDQVSLMVSNALAEINRRTDKFMKNPEVSDKVKGINLMKQLMTEDKKKKKR